MNKKIIIRQYKIFLKSLTLLFLMIIFKFRFNQFNLLNYNTNINMIINSLLLNILFLFTITTLALIISLKVILHKKYYWNKQSIIKNIVKSINFFIFSIIINYSLIHFNFSLNFIFVYKTDFVNEFFMLLNTILTFFIFLSILFWFLMHKKFFNIYKNDLINKNMFMIRYIQEYKSLNIINLKLFLNIFIQKIKFIFLKLNKFQKISFFINKYRNQKGNSLIKK